MSWEVWGRARVIRSVSPIDFYGGFLMRYEAIKSGPAETYRPIKFPGASQQAASGINDAGNIVGYYPVSSGGPQGYLESGGAFTTIDVPFSGAEWTVPFGINNAGDIVGYWLDSNTSHGFLLSGGTYTSFYYPGATFTIAIGINNHGEIVKCADNFVDSRVSFRAVASSQPLPFQVRSRRRRTVSMITV